VNLETALAHVSSSLQQGAELRTKVNHDCGPSIVKAASMIATCLRSGGKLLIFGNGGSAADAQHLAAGFVEGFVKRTPRVAGGGVDDG
jgi:D-sedoheptulose 7-phosphate isomerase